MSSLRILSQTVISSLLNQGNPTNANEIVDLMATTFSAYTNGHKSHDKSAALGAQAPLRVNVTTDNHKVLFMPSRLDQTTSIKVVSVPTRDNDSRGLPASVLVLDQDTGAVETIMNGGSLTAVRTAAGSGLATRYYANPESKTLVVMGAGAQGRSHIDMMIAVRPSIKRVMVWNRGVERREALVKAIQTDYPSIEVKGVSESDGSLKEAVNEADIVCTCTNASQPVLKGAWLKPGVHLNCVGSYTMEMHEVDADTVKRAETIVVDSISACASEAGELVKSSKPDQWVEIGEVVSSSDLQEKATKARDTITLFKSVGISVQDSAIAGLMNKRAKEAGLGDIVDF
ncbi:hypothetical protein CLU79DRAFT_738267 [Phycomyces nitens]|nr:hypothetical protein CLU79DRAFT_738267 [Phycomyces nitens]